MIREIRGRGGAESETKRVQIPQLPARAVTLIIRARIRSRKRMAENRTPRVSVSLPGFFPLASNNFAIGNNERDNVAYIIMPRIYIYKHVCSLGRTSRERAKMSVTYNRHEC